MIKRTVSGAIVDARASAAAPPASRWIARDEWGDPLECLMLDGAFAVDAAEDAARILWERGETGGPITVEVQCLYSGGQYVPASQRQWIRVTVDVACEIEFSARPLNLAKRRRRRKEPA
jgi:hypothetical protein